MMITALELDFAEILVMKLPVITGNDKHIHFVEDRHYNKKRGTDILA